LSKLRTFDEECYDTYINMSVEIWVKFLTADRQLNVKQLAASYTTLHTSISRAPFRSRLRNHQPNKRDQG